MAFDPADPQMQPVPWIYSVQPSGQSLATFLGDVNIKGSFNSSSISVLNFPGVDPTGATDSATGLQTAINAMLSTGTPLHFPAGQYQLCTLQSSPVSDLNPPALLINNANNWAITADPGASLVCCNASTFSSQIMVNNCKNFSISGFTNIGNRTGLTPSQENAAFALNSCVNGNISNIHIAGNWAAEGAGFAMSWIFDTVFRDILFDSVGIGFDTSFLQDCLFANIGGTGSSTNPSGAGDRMFSIVYDPPSLANNFTGKALRTGNTNGITIINPKAYNFGAGVFLSSGAFVNIIGGNLTQNIGNTNGNVAGIGVYIYYELGTFTSVGNPPGQITIVGNNINENGVPTTAGYGVLIDATLITNTDTINGITINGNNFYNNQPYGVEVLNPAKVAGIGVVGNTFDGSLQTGIGPNLKNGLVSAATPFNAQVSGNIGLNPLTVTTPPLPAGVGAANTVTNTNPCPVLVAIPAQIAAYAVTLVQPPGGGNFGMNTVTAAATPVFFTLPPGWGVFFVTAVPATNWKWLGM